MEEVAPTAIVQSSENALIDLKTMRASLAKNCARSVLPEESHSDGAILFNPACFLQLLSCFCSPRRRGDRISGVFASQPRQIQSSVHRCPAFDPGLKRLKVGL